MFSVGPDKKVQFTRSNLYWDGQDWKFESNPMNFPIEWNPNHVGHLYWALTATAACQENFRYPEVTSEDRLFCDGSDDAHTLTVEGITGLRTFTAGPEGEVEYLLESRSNASELYRFPVEFEGVGPCMVIAPDDYTGTIEPYYDSESWILAESKGLVCFSRCGRRLDNEIIEYNSWGNYWSSSLLIEKREGFESFLLITAYPFKFSDNYFVHSQTVASRNNGYSIRLVKDVN